MSAERAHPSELAWARYLAGESRGLAAWRHRRHLASCERCRQLEAAMAEERRSFDADPLRRRELGLLHARAAEPSRGNDARSVFTRWRWMLAGGAAAAAAIASVAVRAPKPAPVLIQKGQDVFTLHVQRPSGAVSLEGSCAPGDRIIGRYRTLRTHLLVLERDGVGRIQVLVSTDGATSMRLPAAEGTTPSSWILDAVPGRECFAAFFSDQPLDAAAATRALNGSPGGPALPGASVRMQCCDKGAGK